jgi:uncharacterized protein YceH (UPF0502 family)
MWFAQVEGAFEDEARQHANAAASAEEAQLRVLQLQEEVVSLSSELEAARNAAGATRHSLCHHFHHIASE